MTQIGILKHPVTDEPLDKVKLIDCANIELEKDYAKERSDQIMIKARQDLVKVLRQIKTIHKAVAYVVGGSDEMSLPLVQTSTT